MKKILLIIIVWSVAASYAKTENIALVINSDLYPKIKNSIETYKKELKDIQNINVVWINTSYDETRDRYMDLWKEIKAHYESDKIDGITFIGDLPVVDCGTGDFNPDPQCDLFWMDMDENVFTGSGPEYTSYNGSGPEIWMTRITSSYFENEINKSEADIVNDYFAKVSLRMHGGLVDPDTSYFIIGNDEVWPGIDDENENALYYKHVEVHLATQGENTNSMWKKGLYDGQEYFFVFNHSNYNAHYTEPPSYINELYDSKVDIRFGSMYACLNARLDYPNMVAAYGLLNKGLVCIGAGKSGGIKPGHFNKYNDPLNDENNLFGDAWKIWWQTDGIYNMDWGSAQSMEGVGTLKLRPYQSGHYLAISKPTSGTVWEQNSSYTITWSDNIDANVKIELLKGGSSFSVISNSTESDGKFDITLSDTIPAGDDYKIKITDIDSSNLFDVSDKFSIIEEFIITKYPYTNDYEDLDSGTTTLDSMWTQENSDDIDWLVWRGPTPSRVGSSPDKTGAESGFGGNGNYIYVEASDPNNPNKKATIVSPKFDLTKLKKPILSLNYHMFSELDSMGEFNLEINPDNRAWEKLATISGDQGDSWKELSIPIEDDYKKSRVRFRLNGITGPSWCGDICIDNFMIRDDADANSFKNVLFSSSNYKLFVKNGKLFLNSPTNSSNRSFLISIYDLSGKLLTKRIFKNISRRTIKISDKKEFSSGLYICKIQSGSAFFSKKILFK